MRLGDLWRPLEGVFCAIGHIAVLERAVGHVAILEGVVGSHRWVFELEMCVEILQLRLLLLPSLLQPCLHTIFILWNVLVLIAPNMEVHFLRIDSVPSINFHLWQYVWIADTDVVDGIHPALPEHIHDVVEASGPWVEAVAIAREIVLIGVFVADTPGLWREVSSFREQEQLYGVVDGVEVMELLLELESVSFPLARDEEETTELHAVSWEGGREGRRGGEGRGGEAGFITYT